MSMPGNASRHPIKDWGKSRTRQSEAKYADINLIMAKYEKTGVLPPATRQGFFADVSTVGDYREALERVEKMDRYFYHIPPDIRKKFDNDPAVFLDFVSDPANLPEMESLGIIAKSDDDVPPGRGAFEPATPSGGPAEPAIGAPEGS